MDWKNFAEGTIGGGLVGGGLYDWLGGGQKDPADEYMKYAGQIPGATGKYLNPYIDQGQQAGAGLNTKYLQMMNDPSSILQMLGQGYQKSPGYDWNLKQGEQGINNAYAAGGMAGSPAHQQEAGQMASHYADQDYDQYLNHALTMLTGGIAGQQGIADRGYDASSSMASMIANLLGNQGQSAYQSAAQSNASRSQGMNNIFSGLGALSSFL